MKKYSIIIFSIISCTIVLSSLQSCSGNKNDSPETAEKYVLPDSLLKTLQIDSVINTGYSSAITLTGQVDYDEDHVIKIYPMVSGVAQNVKPVLGDYVHAGDELAVLRSSDVTNYGNSLQTAESNVQIAKKNRDAVVSMYKSGLSSQVDSVNAEQQYIQAKANYSAALHFAPRRLPSDKFLLHDLHHNQLVPSK